ncbi:GPI mannosyltransferase 3 [Aphis craccivora]|uniref:Mannosyltransferase n=1 Tax=Aphis craccivora TaxID=307492 RepID=A0A6G0Y5R0_APHCR|nr:GPI mannosyltransferase 3 [Aphis craccivora]
MKYPTLLIVGTSLLSIRLFHLYIVHSWYVPDEYWQSLEIAHYITFGFGYRTWEWIVGIRSYISVSWIVIIYQILKYFSLDTLQLLIWSPRFLQTLFSTYSDYCFVCWIQKRAKCSNVFWPLVCYMTNPFLAYCSTRTLVNTLETNLTTIALYYYPWSLKSKDVTFLWIVAFVCIIRPTAIIVWIPLIVFDFFAHKRYNVNNLARYICIGLTSIIFSITLDTYLHGSFVVTQWNFLYYNIIKKVNAHYSIENWYWYFVSGLPPVLGPVFFIFIYCFIKKLRFINLYDTDSKLVITVFWSLSVLSMVAHKEQRFLLPLFPMIFFITSEQISVVCKKFIKLGTLTVILNIIVLIYLGRYHQIGSTSVMSHLAELPQHSKLLFLMPCHSTPLFSHLHMNITARILTCEPNLHGISNYTDEADVFFENPNKWLEESYSAESKKNLPTHIVMFDQLLNKVQAFLTRGKCKNILTIFHSDFPSARTGQYIYVFSCIK